MAPAKEPGYLIKEISNNYANIQQRWLIVFSQAAYDKQYATLTKNIRKECEKKEKEFWHLSKNAFACEADTMKAANDFSKKIKYRTLEYSVVNLKDEHYTVINALGDDMKEMYLFLKYLSDTSFRIL